MKRLFARNVLIAATLISPFVHAEDRFSYVGKNVLTALAASHTLGVGKTWGPTVNQELDPDWLLQTPLGKYWGVPASGIPLPAQCEAGSAGCESDYMLKTCKSNSDCGSHGLCSPVASSVKRVGDPAKLLCVGHSDAMVDNLYRAMIEAESFVDLSTLTLQDGRFQAAIRNAVTYLASKNKPIQVRVLYGSFPLSGVDVDASLKELVRDVPKDSKLTVHVAKYSHTVTTWNHAKILAVDGKVVIAGGTNLWTTHYLNENPMHDMLMRVRGGAALVSHSFLNQQWDIACRRLKPLQNALTAATVRAFPNGAPPCPQPFDTSRVKLTTGSLPIIPIGRLGAAGDNASDDGILAMMRAAKRELWISQQDVGPVKRGVTLGRWPEAWLREVVGALGRGVNVYLILSGFKAVPGGLTGKAGALATYSNGYQPEDVANEIYDRAIENASLFASGNADIRTAVCERLHVAPIRASADETWPDGVNLGNHAKTYRVDDQAFYIGSQNAYWSNNAEYGFVVDDAKATASYTQAYWSKLWEHSKRAAVSGSGARKCLIK